MLVGSVTVRASATLSGPGSTDSNPLSFNVVHGAATQIALTGSIADLASGSPRTYTATVQDAAGNTATTGPDSTVSVSFAQTGGTGTVSGTGSATAAAGVATKSLTGVLAGSVTVRASATLAGPGATNSNTLTFNVTAGPATSLSLAAATTTPTAGAADNLTITAKDAAGNTATGYTGPKNLTFGGASAIGANNPTVSNSSGTAINFGSTTAITFTSGVASVSAANNGVMKLYKAETANITVSDGTINNGTGLSVTVSPATAASLTLAAATTTPTAGSGDNLTITTKDAYGNIATGYTGDKNLTFGGANAIGSFNPTVSDKNGTARNFSVATTITFAGGVASVSGSNNGVMTLYKAEAASITVSDGTVNNGTGLSVTVSAATAASLALTAATTTPVAGAADNLTVTAKDAYGNTAISYTGDKNLTFAGAATIGSNVPTVTNKTGVATNFGTATTITFSSGVASVSGSNNGVMKLYKKESASITVSDGTLNNGAGLSVTVSSTGTATKLSLTAATTTPTAGAGDNLTITAQDTYGNTETSYTGDKSLTFTGASTIGTFVPKVSNNTGVATNFGTATTITFTNGVATTSGANNGVMTLYKAETVSIVVTQGSLNNGTGLSVTVSAAAPSVFRFTNCSVNGGTNQPLCAGPFNVGNSPGHYDGHVSVFDTWLNAATVTGSPLTVTLSNSGSANYSISANPTIAVGATESGSFTVTHLNNSNNSTTVATTNSGFTQASLTVSK